MAAEILEAGGAGHKPESMVEIPSRPMIPASFGDIMERKGLSTEAELQTRMQALFHRQTVEEVTEHIDAGTDDVLVALKDASKRQDVQVKQLKEQS
eukprot:CAMPEP_0181039920 /NCGR_PEP_ID=MMETSP1070-20121207/10757_1 /TAXON_ID=265543 /ORGANISM="Minutocellus polymorphus, Strain NH13" /LENGTH=95 /DNA_ID=CAMNT_0023117865 /DNA_START=451 /DNA_END=736 /DNA_ORIENTATION=-